MKAKVKELLEQLGEAADEAEEASNKMQGIHRKLETELDDEEDKVFVKLVVSCESDEAQGIIDGLQQYCETNCLESEELHQCSKP